MAQRETTLRHLEIINLLKTKGKASFEEIENHLADRSKFHKNDLLVSKRTFQRDINNIALIYNIEISCDRNDGNLYRIEESPNADISGKYAMEAFEIFSVFNVGHDLNDLIFPESERPKGTENMYNLISAARNKCVVRFSYDKYYGSSGKIRTVYPLGLRESEGRWFLFAYCTKRNDLRFFALDRICNLEVTDQNHNYELPLPPAKFFEMCVGLDIPDSGFGVREVVLSFVPERADHIKAFPLHGTQEILTDDKKELRIRLLISVTKSFFRELQKYAGEVKIISPKSLRNDYRAILKKGMKMNE